MRKADTLDFLEFVEARVIRTKRIMRAIARRKIVTKSKMLFHRVSQSAHWNFEFDT